MAQKKSFRCHGCGACCTALGDILNSPIDKIDEEFRKDVLDFPYKADNKGWCEKLGEDMKCTVYENRPLLCRVDSHFERLDNSQSREEYYAETEEACKFLMSEKLGMSEAEIEKVYANL